MSPMLGKLDLQLLGGILFSLILKASVLLRSFPSEYHLVPLEHNLDSLYNALCEGQSLNPDEDVDGNDGGAATSLGGIDLSGFTWAEGYGPESLLGPGPGGDGGTARQMANLDVSKRKIGNS